MAQDETREARLPDVIADVGATLQQLLLEQIPDPLDGEGRVVLQSPADVDMTAGARLGLFLYQVLEFPEMRNYPPESTVTLDGREEERRYQTIELFYLVTPYMDRIEDTHRLLGRVMRVFFEYGIVQGSILRGSLADIGQELRILLHPLSMEDLNRLWGLFPNKPYRLSVAYQVTPVRIVAGPLPPAGRVVTRQLSYTQPLERR
jgi:uncharacterized protein DUF4255